MQANGQYLRGSPKLAQRSINPQFVSLALGLFFCLLAWSVRLAVVGAHALHPDEALYGHYGMLILSGRDTGLAAVSVYKPPLVPYLFAGSLALLGRSVLAIRLPGILAGTVTIGLTARLARHLYRDPLAGLVAAMASALSPLAFLFSATAFTDPIMVALGLAGCVATVENRPGWGGLLAGLSFAAKRTGVIWIVLVGLLIPISWEKDGRTDQLLPRLARGLLGFLGITAVVLLWDQARVAQGATSFWLGGAAEYGGLRLVWQAEQGQRFWAWLGWLRHLLGSPWLEGVLLAGVIGMLVRGMSRATPTWEMVFDEIIIGFCIVYLLVHWLWAFPVWSRYLLPLIPLVSILLGRTVSFLARFIWIKTSPRPLSLRRWWVNGTALIAVGICLTAPAKGAIAGEVKAGAGWAVYDGIEQVTGYLETLDEGSVLYHHWLGWAYGFYLFDGPLYLAYWPTPAWLAQDVQAFGEAGSRYIVFPAWEASARVEMALAEVGYRLETLVDIREQGEIKFTVYQIKRLQSAIYNPRSTIYNLQSLGVEF